MPEYLVELYAIGASEDAAALARACEDSKVRYVRSISIPGDEMSLHVLEAESAADVEEAVARAGLSADRVVEAVELRLPRRASRGRMCQHERKGAGQ